MELRARVQDGLDTPAAPDRVYALLADVGRSVGHFPDLERVDHVGDVWTWRLRPLGAGPLTFQVHYACRYQDDPARRTVWWEPIDGVGNTRVSGRWTVTPRAAGSRFDLDTTFTLQAPFPRLMRGAAEALLARENARVVRAYLENLGRTLAGGDGAVSRARVVA